MPPRGAAGPAARTTRRSPRFSRPGAGCKRPRSGRRPAPGRLERAAPETGYWIGRPFWGRGFATEALEGALVWAGKRWKRRALMAGHFADNPVSGRVLEKAGFLYTGETRPRFSLSRGEAVDTRMMVWLA